MLYLFLHLPELRQHFSINQCILIPSRKKVKGNINSQYVAVFLSNYRCRMVSPSMCYHTERRIPCHKVEQRFALILYFPRSPSFLASFSFLFRFTSSQPSTSLQTKTPLALLFQHKGGRQIHLLSPIHALWSLFEPARWDSYISQSQAPN